MIIDEYGREIRSLPEQVSKNQSDIATLDSDLVALTALVQNALAGVLHYKGSVATYGDLPTSGQEVGDVYNVIDTGANYAWDGSGWDELGSIIDTSLFAEKAGNNTFTGDNEFVGDVEFDGSSQRVIFGEQTAVLSNNGYDFGEQDSQVASITHSGAYEEFSFYDVNSGNSVCFDFLNEKIYTSTSSMDLGDSTHLYSQLFLSSRAWFNEMSIRSVAASNVLDICSGTYTRFTFSDTVFAPYTNNYADLGTSAIKWKNLYMQGVFRIGSNVNLSTDGNGLVIAGSTNTRFNGAINPYVNNQYDLGSSIYAWKDIYLSGNLSNGTDTATVADIAALITYAKAQGWIS